MRYSLLLPVPMLITPSPKASAAIRSWTCWTEQSSSSATAETRSQVYAAISCCLVRIVSPRHQSPDPPHRGDDRRPHCHADREPDQAPGGGPDPHLVQLR